MNAKLISFARLLVRILIVARQSPYPLNSTQNHLIHSTLRIFNLSTQPLFSLHSKGLLFSKRADEKRTPNSRKCLVFKPFSVFTSVLLTSRLRTQRASCCRINLRAELFPSCSRFGGDIECLELGCLDCRRHRRFWAFHCE